MKGLCKLALVALVVAACGGDGITEPVTPIAPPVSGGILALGVDSTTGASIETDRDDYVPGEVVHLVGRGWAPGETVNLHMTEEPNTHADVDTNVVADAAGSFSIHFYDVVEHDLGVTFKLTATGLSSNSAAVVEFEDGAWNLTISSISPASPAQNATFSATGSIAITGTGANTWKATLWWIDSGTRTCVNISDVTKAPPSTESFSLTGLTAPGTSGAHTLWVQLWETDDCTDPSGPIGSLGGEKSFNFEVAAPSNAAPTVNAGGPYTVAEGSSIQLTSATAADPNGDVLTYSWSLNTTGIDAGGTCSFSPNNQVLNPNVSCTDDSQGAAGGKFTLTLQVDDGNSHIVSSNTDLTVNNAIPGAGAAGPYTGDEGSAVALTGTKSDAGSNDTHTYAWSYAAQSGVDVGTTCSFSPSPTVLSPSVTCTDDGVFTVSLVVTDDDAAGSTQANATLTLGNVAPTAVPGGPYSGSEGSGVALTGSSTDAGSHDTHTYVWSYAPQSGVDGGATCAFSPSAVAQNPDITCTDDGVFTVSLVVTDDDGAASTLANATLTLTNANPTANAGGPYSGAEGGPAVAISGTKGDQGSNDTHTIGWSYTLGAGVDAGTTCSFGDAAALSTSVTCTDNGTFTLTLTITDDDGGVGTSSATFTVSNVPPTITTITAPIAPVAAGTNNVTVTWNFADPGTDTWTCSIEWDAGQTPESATYVNPKTCSATKTLAPGLYTVTVKVADDDGGEDSETVQAYIVVYDPNGGFVTGGGWINSLPGYYRTNVLAQGKANFGFVSKYQPGRTIPSGNTEFQFHAGDLNFKSTSYEWLVVAGTKAIYKGEGTISGRTGVYGFLLSAIDASPDKFRIKIWDKASGDVVYDTLPEGAADDADPSTTLGGGSIVVHTKK